MVSPIMRTLVDIPEKELRQLNLLATQEKISRAEAIRRAIDSYLRKAIDTGDAPDVFGLWAKKRLSSLEYEDRVRKEWRSREGRH